MSEMESRVASELHTRALAHGEPFDLDHPIWRDLARVAIEAMREPTDAMDDAGVHVAVSTSFLVDDRLTPYGTGQVHLDNNFMIVTSPEDIYRAMIDAALAKP